jgi:hypothetical protein
MVWTFWFALFTLSRIHVIKFTSICQKKKMYWCPCFCDLLHIYDGDCIKASPDIYIYIKMKYTKLNTTVSEQFQNLIEKS